MGNLISQILKDKFYCKTTQSVSFSDFSNKIEWIEQFTEGKIYDVEYETWTFSKGYEMNNGWRKYWVIDNMGKKVAVDRIRFNILFEELRERNLKILLKNKK